MEKKHFIVEFSYQTSFECESDSEALGAAALSLRYGVEKTKRTMLRVVACMPIASDNKTPAPIESSKAEVLADDMPF